MAEHAGARQHARRTCWRRCYKAILEAAKAPQLQEAFAKQFVSVKPNTSLDDAQAWLKNELATWRKTVAEVKIE